MMMEMKDFNIKSLAAALMLVAAMAGCTDKNLVEDPKQTAGEKTYTMTITATKGGTRALSLDGKTLNATWTAGDEVTVKKGSTSLGTLVAQSSGASTTFTGTVTGDINPDDVLTLVYASASIKNQDGTLEYIAAHCDYAIAIVNVASIDGGNITTKGVANFVNQLVIIRFTLKNADGSPFNVTSLDVIENNITIPLTFSEPRSEFFVAVPSITNKPVALRTLIGEELYAYGKEGVTFTKGQYYSIGVKMKKFGSDSSSGNLFALTADYTAKDGDVLSGTLDNKLLLSIADGATVTLDGVTINTSKGNGITCLGNANIILANGSDNSVTSTKQSYAGIQAGPAGKTLTISGSGSLTATHNNGGAGIGSGGTSDRSCGNITIKGGEVTATGGTGAAGIGCGARSTCGNIVIEGGTITATGGVYAAGIGCGLEGTCVSISISGDCTVTATKGKDAPYSIGSGKDGTCGTVSIYGIEGPIEISPYNCFFYTVKFDKNGGTGSDMADMTFLHDIAQALPECTFTAPDGSMFTGWNTKADGTGTITYLAGQSVVNLTSTHKDIVTLYAQWRQPHTVSINSSTGDLTLQSGDVLSGTGGADTHVTIADGAIVTLSGVDITTIPNDNTHGWAGISCEGDATIILADGTTNKVKGGYNNYPGIKAPSGKMLVIQGSGSLEASSNGWASGIGSAYEGSCGSIVIKSGTITANGGNNAAGIGSGSGGSCGDVTINGGNITATGGDSGAGIGSGSGGSCGDVTITGGTITAQGGSGGAGIGCGNSGSSSRYSPCGIITISGGTVTATGGGKAAGIGGGRYGYFASIQINPGIVRVQATKGNSGYRPIGKGYEGTDQQSGDVYIDGTKSWKAGTATEHFNFEVSRTNYSDDTWTLTPKTS